MPTTGTATFNLNVNEMIEEAFERCGKELRTGYDFRTAKRSMNLLTIEWANRGINLWTIEQGQIPMVTGQAIYPFPVDTIDMYDMVIRTDAGNAYNQTDINISRISESDYLTIPNKLTYGRPIQVWVNRQSGQENATDITLANPGIGITATDTTIQLSSTVGLPVAGFIKIGSETIGYANIDGNSIINAYRGQNNTTAAAHLNGAAITLQNLPCINVWPTPNPPGDQYTFVYTRLRRIQDAGSGTYVQDIPFRFIPAMVAGLAYQLSVKLPEVDPARIPLLKAQYEETFQQAADEDREKAALRIVPRNMFYYR